MSILSLANERTKRCAGLAGGAILVGLSGGKDSLVTLDICCRHFKHVEAFYMYLVKGIRCIESHIERAAAARSVKLHYVPHFELSRMLKYGVYAPHVDEAEKLRQLKRIDVENALIRKTGIQWFAYGERATDSFARRLYVRENDGISQSRTGNSKLFPIWDWRDSNVFGYMRANKIAVPPSFGSDAKSTGFSLDKTVLRWLKKNHPDDWEAVKRTFPYVEAAIFYG